MTTLITIAGVALTSLCAGILSGTLLWHRYMGKRAAPPQRTVTPPGPLLWDIHSLLNAMSRFAVAAERGHPIDPTIVYNIADYLLHSSLLQRERGWADTHAIKSWLQAHLRVLAELRAQGNTPNVSIKFSEDVRRIDANQLIRQLQWLVQRTHTIDLIEIHVTAPSRQHAATVTIAVHGTMDELDHVPMADLPSTWHLAKGKCSCELRADCEFQTTAEAHDA